MKSTIDLVEDRRRTFLASVEDFGSIVLYEQPEEESDEEDEAENDETEVKDET